MPKYFYACAECEKRYSFYHGMEEEEKDCPDCKIKNSLEKMPSSFSIKQHDNTPTKVGHAVKKSIEEFKEELEEQKKDLKSEYTGKNE